MLTVSIPTITIVDTHKKYRRRNQANTTIYFDKFIQTVRLAGIKIGLYYFLFFKENKKVTHLIVMIKRWMSTLFKAIKKQNVDLKLLL